MWQERQIPSGPSRHAIFARRRFGVLGAAAAAGLIAVGGVPTRTAALESDSSRTTTSTLGRSRIEISDRCLECHRIDPVHSHPVGVVPSVPTPEDLPLFQGRLTCLTCHGYEMLDTSHGRDPDGRAWLRTSGTSPALCVTCHDASPSSTCQMQVTHQGRAHLHWTDNTTQRRRGGSGAGLDDESVGCLTCHDGSLAPDAGSHRRMPGSAEFLGPNTGHPIGIRYRDAALNPDGAPMVPLGRLDPRIRLVDGRVACGSCHSPFSALEGDLVMSNMSSALCLSCHDY